MFSRRLINKEIHFKLFWKCVYLSFYFAGCWNDVFEIISQMPWLICFSTEEHIAYQLFKQPHVLSFECRYMHLSEKQIRKTKWFIVILNWKSLWVCFIVHFFFSIVHFAFYFLGYCETYIPWQLCKGITLLQITAWCKVNISKDFRFFSALSFKYKTAQCPIFPQHQNPLNSICDCVGWQVKSTVEA